MSQRSGGPPKKKEPAFSNNPFKAAIKNIQEEQKKAAEAEAQAKAAAEASKAKAKAAPPKPAKSKKAAVQEEDDESLFFMAMGGVQQLTNRGEAPTPNVRLPEKLIDENAEALAQLSEMVSGQGDLDIQGTDEFIEGSSPGTDRNLLRALRRGDFTVQGQLDLHGMTQVQAQAAVEKFLSESRRMHRRCVLIVHGRGLNSRDQIPVLKEGLKQWMSEKRIGRMVLAFATARPEDGGAGAVYVLLRR